WAATPWSSRCHRRARARPTQRFQNMFAKLSIRSKVISVVAFLLVTLAGMGLLAVHNMRSMNANTVDIATNWLPSIRVLGELRSGVITYRNVVREHMLAQTLEEKLASEKILASVVESNSKIRQTYELMISAPEERALYEQWGKLWMDYKKGTEEVMALSRNAGADKAAKDAADSYNSAFVMLAVILGAAVVAGVAVGFYLVRDVSRGIASIVQPMQALGRGELAAEVPHRGEK